ncbi:MAG: hypothetical protein PHU07_13530 [Acidocella sp.]|nr:hypothetical protein [Acidocella sp.]
MRPPCKTIRPTPAAIEAVQRRMQATPYFTRDEVTLWFAEFDQGLEPLNARRAADKLLATLRASGTIVLLSMNRGWCWRGTTEERTAARKDISDG